MFLLIFICLTQLSDHYLTEVLVCYFALLSKSHRRHMLLVKDECICNNYNINEVEEKCLPVLPCFVYYLKVSNVLIGHVNATLVLIVVHNSRWYGHCFLIGQIVRPCPLFYVEPSHCQ